MFRSADPSTQLSILGLHLSPNRTGRRWNNKCMCSRESLDFGDTLPIIMTEKDAVRCLEMNSNNLWYLSVEAKFENEDLAENILNKLTMNK